MTDQLYIGDDGQLESQPLTWDGEPLYSPSTVAEGLFDPGAFQQMPGQMALEPASCKVCGDVAVLPVGCPDMCESCNAATEDDDMWRPVASEALCDALDELQAAGEIKSWRRASDLETRSLWRVCVRLPGCEQLMTEQQGWKLVRNCRELRHG